MQAGSGSLSLDSIECPAQALSLYGIDHFYEAHPAFKMRAKIRVSITILALDSVSDTVGEGGL